MQFLDEKRLLERRGEGYIKVVVRASGPVYIFYIEIYFLMAYFVIP